MGAFSHHFSGVELRIFVTHFRGDSLADDKRKAVLIRKVRNTLHNGRDYNSTLLLIHDDYFKRIYRTWMEGTCDIHVHVKDLFNCKCLC